MAEAARDVGLKPGKIDNSLHMDPRSFIQYVHVDDELHSGDDRLVRDVVQKLKQKFFVKKVGDEIQILARTVERARLGYRVITSRRYIDQSLKDMDMEKCNPVSTPSLQVTERLGDRGAAPRSVSRIVSTSDGPTSPCGRTTTRCATSSERACTRNEFPHKHSLGTTETCDQQPMKLETMSSQPQVTVTGEAV